jgi:hypothetical protein
MSPESHQVPVDVLPPLPADAHLTGAHPQSLQVLPPLSQLNTFYHPASGVVILAIDTFVFGTEMVSGFLDTPVMSVLAFMATLPLVFLIQWKWSRNSPASAFGKAFLGAFLAGLPFSITGTMFGAAVLMLSGLPRNPVEAFRKLTTPKA